MRKLAGLSAFVVVATLAAGGRAAVWNAANDFSATSNPNGAWSYGDYGGGGSSGTLDPTTFVRLPVQFSGAYGSIEGWEMPGPANPVVSHNSSLADTVGSFSDPTTYTTQWLPNEVALHPLDGPTAVRWTAPAAGEYQVSGDFFPTQGENAPANAYVYSDTTQEVQFLSVSSTVSFSLLLDLNAGDTVDFVAWGDNAYNKTTGLDATIASVGAPPAVPEPATLIVWSLLGGVGVASCWWRRPRAV
jgi:hypothetical protein